MIETAKANYLFVFFLTIVALFLFLDGTITGNVVLEESPYYYIEELDVYLFQIDSETIVRYFSEEGVWQEVDADIEQDQVGLYGSIYYVISIQENKVPIPCVSYIDKEGREIILLI